MKKLFLSLSLLASFAFASNEFSIDVGTNKSSLENKAKFGKKEQNLHKVDFGYNYINSDFLVKTKVGVGTGHIDDNFDLNFWEFEGLFGFEYGDQNKLRILPVGLGFLAYDDSDDELDIVYYKLGVDSINSYGKFDLNLGAAYQFTINNKETYKGEKFKPKGYEVYIGGDYKLTDSISAGVTFKYFDVKANNTYLKYGLKDGLSVMAGLKFKF